jgi:hypothetical protein
MTSWWMSLNCGLLRWGCNVVLVAHEVVDDDDVVTVAKELEEAPPRGILLAAVVMISAMEEGPTTKCGMRYM